MSGVTVRKRSDQSLEPLRARDLMSPDPVSLRRDATIRGAVALLTDRGFGAAPVIDEAGRPIGVVSRTDILVHEWEYARHARPENGDDWDLPPRRDWPEGFSAEISDPTPVEEIMTPAVFVVPLDTPAREVVSQLLELKIHQLFVVDSDGSLVGVISALDVLRHL